MRHIVFFSKFHNRSSSEAKEYGTLLASRSNHLVEKVFCSTLSSKAILHKLHVDVRVLPGRNVEQEK